MKRLLSLTAQLQKKPEKLKLFIQEFEKMIANGILVEVTEAEHKRWINVDGIVWYVAYFAVINLASESTPLRIVFDPTHGFMGIIINNMWEPPPNLIPQIPKLILRFREKKVHIAMDISKA